MTSDDDLKQLIVGEEIEQLVEELQVDDQLDAKWASSLK